MRLHTSQAGPLDKSADPGENSGGQEHNADGSARWDQKSLSRVTTPSGCVQQLGSGSFLYHFDGQCVSLNSGAGEGISVAAPMKNYCHKLGRIAESFSGAKNCTGRHPQLPSGSSASDFSQPLSSFADEAAWTKTSSDTYSSMEHSGCGSGLKPTANHVIVHTLTAPMSAGFHRIVLQLAANGQARGIICTGPAPAPGLLTWRFIFWALLTHPWVNFGRGAWVCGRRG